MTSKDTFYNRTQNLVGIDGINKLRNSKVAVFGVGGVGGYVAETLARTGVGSLVLVDGDEVNITNVNRQIIALQTNIGCKKTDEMKFRIAQINPDCVVTTMTMRFNQETLENFTFDYDYIADCIDSVKDKKLLIKTANERGIPIVCSMGAGNHIDIPHYELADVFKTSYDPLARLLRKFCAQERIKHLNVVYTKSPAVKTDVPMVSSIAYHPMAMASIITSKIVNDILTKENKGE